MLILKYSRTGSAAFLPHLDVLRQFGRILRRAELKINYSEGFHPHMLFWFGNPISLGIPSLCDYCAADSPEPPEIFLEKFNRKSVPGIRLLRACKTDKNPNFADILCAAEYEIVCPDLAERIEEVRKIATDPAFRVSYGASGREKEAADKLLLLEAEEKGLRVRLKAGKENLKADAWARGVLGALGLGASFDLVRTKQFFLKEGVLADADELFAAEV